LKISKIHLNQVCKIGQGNECCRYITVGPQGFGCEKHSDLKGVLDAKVNAGEMVAQGDNCAGWGQGRNDKYRFDGPEFYHEFHESRDELQELPNDFKGGR